MFKFIFKKRMKLESEQVYELILSQPHIYKWQDGSEFYCLERRIAGKVKLIQLVSNNIVFRCIFIISGMETFCDLPIMNPSFVPIHLKQEAMEYRQKFGKWPIINLIKGFDEELL
jgi:hypothetical protein